MTGIRIIRRGPVFRFTSGAGMATRPGSGSRAAVRVSKLGARGLTGQIGAPGPIGPPAEDPGDLTLIFNNHLI